MNIELLKRVLKRIEGDYKHFSMRWWGLNKKKGSLCLPTNRLSCGTIGCFAGFTIAEALGGQALTALSTDDEMIDQASVIPNLARNLLGFNDDEVRELFYSQGRDHYEIALAGKVMGTKAYAKATADAIRGYIKEHRGVII